MQVSARACGQEMSKLLLLRHPDLPTTEIPEECRLIVRFGEWFLAVEAPPDCWPIACWIHDDSLHRPWAVEVQIA